MLDITSGPTHGESADIVRPAAPSPPQPRPAGSNTYWTSNERRPSGSQEAISLRPDIQSPKPSIEPLPQARTPQPSPTPNLNAEPSHEKPTAAVAGSKELNNFNNQSVQQSLPKLPDESPSAPSGAGLAQSENKSDTDCDVMLNPTAGLKEPPPSSPLSSIASPLLGHASLDGSHDAVFSRDISASAASLSSPLSSPLSDCKVDTFQVDFDLDAPAGHDEHRIFRLKPTASQWDNFPAILSFAKGLGAARDGCFKVILPDELQGSIAKRETQVLPGNAYKIRQIKRNGFWQVHTVPSEGRFEEPDEATEQDVDVNVELQKLKKIFNKNKDKQIRSIRYRVDVPAWTAAQRKEAGVPERSPIHPLKGDKLEHTMAVIPGIHTPYVYEANNHFGATFQIHAEDYRLVSLNHLYKGRKIWIVIPSTAVDVAEEAFGRKKKCSQFMRHRAEFFFPDKLEKMQIPHRVVDQRPGETIVILPDAYHEGFSTGYTLAEAKNYAEMSWSTDAYQACDISCQLLTAIPEAYMAPLKDGQARLDLCAGYGDTRESAAPKRSFGDDGDEEAAAAASTVEDGDAKRVKLDYEQQPRQL